MEIRIGPGTGGDVEIRHLRVDIRTLGDFSTFMRTELDENLSPMSGRVGTTLGNGATISERNPSADLQTMVQQYAGCLDAMREQLDAFTTNVAIIADAARTIAANYGNTDALAGASMADIAPLLDGAIGTDTPLPPMTPHGAMA
jgi:hypothetical protein